MGADCRALTGGPWPPRHPLETPLSVTQHCPRPLKQWKIYRSHLCTFLVGVGKTTAVLVDWIFIILLICISKLIKFVLLRIGYDVV